MSAALRLPNRGFLSAAEIHAHAAILDAFADWKDCIIGRATLRHRIARACDFFAPRCPAPCGAVLATRTEIGMRFFNCSECGFATKEIRP